MVEGESVNRRRNEDTAINGDYTRSRFKFIEVCRSSSAVILRRANDKSNLTDVIRVARTGFKPSHQSRGLIVFPTSDSSLIRVPVFNQESYSTLSFPFFKLDRFTQVESIPGTRIERYPYRSWTIGFVEDEVSISSVDHQP